MTVGVKYCGGCNPRYDRGAAAHRLQAAFPQLKFLTAQPGIKYDVLLVLCGCPAQCAGLEGLCAGETLLVYGPEGVEKVTRRLENLAPAGARKE